MWHRMQPRTRSLIEVVIFRRHLRRLDPRLNLLLLLERRRLLSEEILVQLRGGVCDRLALVYAHHAQDFY